MVSGEGSFLECYLGLRERMEAVPENPMSSNDSFIFL